MIFCALNVCWYTHLYIFGIVLEILHVDKDDLRVRVVMNSLMSHIFVNVFSGIWNRSLINFFTLFQCQKCPDFIQYEIWNSSSFDANVSGGYKKRHMTHGWCNFRLLPYDNSWGKQGVELFSSILFTVLYDLANGVLVAALLGRKINSEVLFGTKVRIGRISVSFHLAFSSMESLLRESECIVKSSFLAIGSALGLLENESVGNLGCHFPDLWQPFLSTGVKLI